MQFHGISAHHFFDTQFQRFFGKYSRALHRTSSRSIFRKILEFLDKSSPLHQAFPISNSFFWKIQSECTGSSACPKTEVVVPKKSNSFQLFLELAANPSRSNVNKMTSCFSNNFLESNSRFLTSNYCFFHI